jgi:hypothetical protein
MKVKARMSCHPAVHSRMLVSGVVVHDQFDDDSFLLGIETLEGDASDLIAFAQAGSDVTTHDAEAARRLSWLHSRQTTNLLKAGTPE